MAFNANEHMMKLKGRDYLQVMWRLVWFREEHPDWTIDANIVEMDADHAVFKAVICDENGQQKSAGHGSESKRDFGDFMEKAETKAVGRALAMLGYGTQFAPELDEGERIVDSPVKREEPKAEKKPEPIVICGECGKAVQPITTGDGKILYPNDIADMTHAKYGIVLCPMCAKKRTGMKAGMTA